MEELERLLSLARALEAEAETTDNAAARLVLLAQAAEMWLHINNLLNLIA